MNQPSTLNAETPGESMRVAAIDVGSNSVNMVIADITNGIITGRIASKREGLRLAEMFDEKGALRPVAFTELTSALRAMKAEADHHGASIRAIGTHALREATNGRELCAKLKKKTGVDVEIIPGQEEARLIYLGVTQNFPRHDSPLLVFEIGGGSAEIYLECQGEEHLATSLKLGAVRLSCKFLKSDQISSDEIATLKGYVTEKLGPPCHEVRKTGFSLAIATGGSIRNLKNVAASLQGSWTTRCPNGAILTVEEINSLVNTLSQFKNTKALRELPGMDKKRADTAIAAAHTLQIMTTKTGVHQWVLSTSAIREGILIDTYCREQDWINGDSNDVRWRTVRKMARRFEVDESHARHVTSLALELFDALKVIHRLPQRWREYLRAASHLHEIGAFVDHSGCHKHGYYLLRNSPMTGFTQRENDILALIVKYHRKMIPDEKDDLVLSLEESDAESIAKCALFLRIATFLDRERQGLVRHVRLVECSSSTCRMMIDCDATFRFPLESAIARELRLHFNTVFNFGLELVPATARNDATVTL